MGGYVKLWRSSLDKGWLKSGPLWCFWTWCLLKASYKTHTEVVGLRKILLEPGQFITTYPKAAAEIGISPQQARDFILALKNLENITVKTTNKFSVITIVNWATYQSDDCEANSQNNSQNNSQTTVKQQTKNPSVIQVLVKEGKEGRKNKDGVVAGAGAHAFKEATELPSWIPIQIWKDFKEFRLKKRAPLTDRAIKKTIEELARLRNAGDDPEAVLEQSIYRGWTGVFALKSDFKTLSRQTRAEKSKASLEVFARRECERQREESEFEQNPGGRPPTCADDGLLPDRGL